MADLLGSGFTLEPQSAQGFINSGNVNVRSVPTPIGNEPVGKLQNHTPVTISGKVTTEGKPSEWYQIKFDNADAYVSTEFVTIDVPVQKPVPPPADLPSGVLPVHWISQIMGGSGHNACGETSVKMLLGYYSKDTGDSIRHLADRLGKWEQHTGASDLIKLAGLYGVTLAQLAHDTTFDPLKAELTNQKPAIILVNYLDLGFPVHLGSGANQGLHWLVVIGYNADNGGTFYLNDPLWLQQQRKNLGGSCIAITEAQFTKAVSPNLANYIALT